VAQGEGPKCTEAKVLSFEEDYSLLFVFLRCSWVLRSLGEAKRGNKTKKAAIFNNCLFTKLSYFLFRRF